MASEGSKEDGERKGWDQVKESPKRREKPADHRPGQLVVNIATRLEMGLDLAGKHANRPLDAFNVW